MIQKEITLECGARQLMRARGAVNALSGVVAAEIVTGRNAIHVWQGDELSDQALISAVSASGVSRARIR